MAQLLSNKSRVVNLSIFLDRMYPGISWEVGSLKVPSVCRVWLGRCPTTYTLPMGLCRNMINSDTSQATPAVRQPTTSSNFPANRH